MMPATVHAAMVVAAWAAAEDCPVAFGEGGALELFVRYEPTAELADAFHGARSCIVGALGWAIPIIHDHRGRPLFASWPSPRGEGWS